MFFEHVNFQPRASRAQHFYFLQNGPCRYKFVTVPLPKRLRNGRFSSETATWTRKWFKIFWIPVALRPAPTPPLFPPVLLVSLPTPPLCPPVLRVSLCPPGPLVFLLIHPRVLQWYSNSLVRPAAAAPFPGVLLPAVRWLSSLAVAHACINT
jgi:hypothetical protein